ncbi:MAG: hypothetical protein NVSMB57_12070 [Actinomycetota bacterium]
MLYPVDYSGYEPATTIFDGLKDTFLGQGYAVAGVNIRGPGYSGGTFDYFEPVEWQDGYDAIEFLADAQRIRRITTPIPERDRLC